MELRTNGSFVYGDWREHVVTDSVYSFLRFFNGADTWVSISPPPPTLLTLGSINRPFLSLCFSLGSVRLCVGYWCCCYAVVGVLLCNSWCDDAAHTFSSFSIIVFTMLLASPSSIPRSWPLHFSQICFILVSPFSLPIPPLFLTYPSALLYLSLPCPYRLTTSLYSPSLFPTSPSTPRLQLLHSHPFRPVLIIVEMEKS